MQSVKLTKPTVFMTFGYPGAGKTFFARQFAEQIGAFHLNADRIRHHLFEEFTFSNQENAVVAELMNYMYEELLSSGVSIVFDDYNSSLSQRRRLRNLAAGKKYESVIVWVQTDMETSLKRAVSRDRRNPDDKYSIEIDSSRFKKLKKEMTKPSSEQYVVISGKHTFKNQLNSVLNKLASESLLSSRENNNAGSVARHPSRASISNRRRPKRRVVNG